MKRTSRQIIAMGGGGFSMEPDNPALDLYVLAQTRKRNPSICFLATATGDADGYIEKFYDAFKAHRCRPTHAPPFRRTPDLKQLLLTQDVIYVGGGNTKSMLAVWREWNVPRLLRRAWSTGTVLAGISAGAIRWFKTGVTDSWGDRLTGLPCLGFLPGTCCPHLSRPRCLWLRSLPAAVQQHTGEAGQTMRREIERIEKQLQLSFEGPAWHGPSVLEALEGVSSENAHAHPIAGAHSIWELVLHLIAGYRLVLRRLRGDARQLTAEEEWPSIPAPTAAGWQDAIRDLRELNHELRRAVLGFDAERLDEPLVAEPPYTAYTQFIGTTQHDLYHAGQIVLLKRALAAAKPR